MQTAQDLQLPVTALSLSPDNVRKTPASANAETELRASILHHGLLGNLTAIDSGDGETYEVIAGGRRLAAIRALIDSGELPGDYAVPVKVVKPNGSGAAELSLAENTMRHGMHPADQVETYYRLVSEGASIDDIAARFGVSSRTVERYAAVGNVAPEIIELFRDGTIRFDVLQAFSVTSDHTRQIAALESYKAERGEFWRNAISAWGVKAKLTNEALSSDCAICVLAGRQDYLDAGGRIDRDLFSDTEEDTPEWFIDQDIVNMIATAKLGEAAEAIRNEWKWVEIQPDIAHSALLGSYGREIPKPSKFTKAEQAKFDKLRSRSLDLMQVDDSEMSDEEYNDHHLEIETSEYEMAQLVEKRDSRTKYSAAQRKRSGVIVTVGDNGDIRYLRGLVKPEDVKAPDNAASANGSASTPAQSTGSNGAGYAPQTNGSAPANNAPKAIVQGMSNGLSQDLAYVRNNIVRNDLAQNPDSAIDLLTFYTARAQFSMMYTENAFDAAINKSGTRPYKYHQAANAPAWQDPAEDQFTAAVAALPMSWASSDLSYDESWAAFMALDESQRRSILSHIVAASLKPHIVSDDPSSRSDYMSPVEDVVRTMQTDFTAYRPAETVYWNRLTKAAIIDQVETTLGTDKAKSLASLKKTELVPAVAKLFAAGNNDTTQNWSIPGFAPNPIPQASDTEQETGSEESPA